MIHQPYVCVLAFLLSRQGLVCITAAASGECIACCSCPFGAPCAGIAHNDQVPSRDIWPWVQVGSCTAQHSRAQRSTPPSPSLTIKPKLASCGVRTLVSSPHPAQEALDGIEFISGPASSTWGSRRAAMGRPRPWQLNFLAIGNEARLCCCRPAATALRGPWPCLVKSAPSSASIHRQPSCSALLLLLQGCGLPWDPPNPDFKPFYWKNYLAFYGALRAAHPALHLIANCHLGDLAPTEIWEYHVSWWGGCVWLSLAQTLRSCRTAVEGRMVGGALVSHN
jgi:hypothetical protein